MRQNYFHLSMEMPEPPSNTTDSSHDPFNMLPGTITETEQCFQSNSTLPRPYHCSSALPIDKVWPTFAFSCRGRNRLPLFVWFPYHDITAPFALCLHSFRLCNIRSNCCRLHSADGGFSPALTLLEVNARKTACNLVSLFSLLVRRLLRQSLPRL